MAFANVQIVRPNGSVHLVQQIGGSEVELSDDGPSKFSIEADDSYPGEKGLCYVVGYRGWWDPEARKFKTIFERESTEPELPAHHHVTEPKESVEPGERIPPTEEGAVLVSLITVNRERLRQALHGALAFGLSLAIAFPFSIPGLADFVFPSPI